MKPKDVKLVAWRDYRCSTGCPWTVTVDGKPDPTNREFKNEQDIIDCYEALKTAGLITSYSLTFIQA